jgi:hypothetical protein
MEVSLERPLGAGPTADPDAGAPPLRLIDLLPDPSSPIPDQVLERAEFQQALESTLGQVPDVWREPLLLHAADGYSLDEVARLEGVPLPEARRRIAHARRVLRARLAEEFEDRTGPPRLETLLAAVERTEPTAGHQARVVERLTGSASGGDNDDVERTAAGPGSARP